MIELLQEYWRPFLYSDGNHITGLAMTLWLLSAALIIGFVLSIPLSIARVSSRRWIRWPVQFYTYVFRGTPLYIQLLICYTGIYSIAAVRAQPLLNEFFRDAMNCTVLAFALNTCAYTTEIFAGAIRSMAHGEIEAAKAYGLKRWQRFRFVVFPQMMRFALPGIGNNWRVMLKATALVSIIGLADLVKAAQDAGKSTYELFYFLVIAALIYLAITSASNVVLRRLERRYAVGCREAVR